MGPNPTEPVDYSGSYSSSCLVNLYIRVGAWDHSKWSHIVPIKENNNLLATKVIVYAGESDEYFTFMTPEVFRALESWMNFRKKFCTRRLQLLFSQVGLHLDKHFAYVFALE